MGQLDPDSTRTPLVAWGKYIRGPLPDVDESSHTPYSSPWGTSLKKLLRVDVEQADVAALMASVLGINFPVNSVGVVPDVRGKGIGYLNVGIREKAEVAMANAKVYLGDTLGIYVVTKHVPVNPRALSSKTQ
jgi:phosphatidylinositol glycan class N